MRNPDRQTRFSFKQFEMSNCRSAMKIGTDGVLLGAWAIGAPISSQPDEELSIMDVGSGTGLIALMLAQRFPKATIVGVECDRDAAEEGADNFAGSPWHENLQWCMPISTPLPWNLRPRVSMQWYPTRRFSQTAHTHLTCKGSPPAMKVR